MTFFRQVKNTAIKQCALISATATLLACSMNVTASEVVIMEGESLKKSEEILAQYGITKELPKLGISSLVQGEHLVEHIHRTITIAGETEDIDAYLIKRTDEKNNIDLRIKYNTQHVEGKPNLLKEIERSTRIQYRLRNWAQSYDPASVKVTNNNGVLEVNFNYSKYGLPQDIAYFRFLKVKVLVIDGQPQNMTITNNKAFKMDGYNVDSYVQKITFDKLSSGNLIIKEKAINIIGYKGKKPVTITENITPVAFYNDNQDVEILDNKRLSEVSDPRYIEDKVDINRTFPLMGDMVRQQGIDLPLPFGLSMTYRNQDMSIPTNDFIIGGIRLNDFFDPNDTFANVNAEALTIRGDVNILPFWNAFGYLGKVNVDANVDASYTGEAGQLIKDKLNNKHNGLGDAFCDQVSLLCQKGRLNVPLHLEYDLVGVGTTLSMGYKEFFASVTGSYSMTKMKGATNWGDGLVTVQPMLGYQLADYRTQIFVGAEYQGLKNRMQGTVITDDISFDYDVGVDLNSWAYLIGVNKQIGKNYNLSVLYNKGETRNSTTLNLGYRF